VIAKDTKELTDREDGRHIFRSQSLSADVQQMGGQTTVEVTRAGVKVRMCTQVATADDLPESIDGNEDDGPLERVCPVREQRCVSCRLLGRPRTKVCSGADGKEDEGGEGGEYLPSETTSWLSRLDGDLLFVLEQRTLFVAGVGSHRRVKRATRTRTESIQCGCAVTCL